MKPDLRELRAFYSVELRNLVDAVERLTTKNEPMTFTDIARLKSLSISASLAGQRLSDALREAINPREKAPISLTQFFTRAAIDASYEVRQ